MKKLMYALCLLLCAALLLTACAETPAGPQNSETTAAPTVPANPTTAAPTTAEPETTTAAVPETSVNWITLVGQGEVGFTLPDFSVETVNGGTFTLSEALQDHELVFLNLWATWCGPCNEEFPCLEEAYQRYGDRVAVIALSVEPNDSDKVLRGFAENNGLSFLVGRDEGSRLSYCFNVNSIPTSIMVDRTRTVVWTGVGAIVSADAFARLFDRYLAEAAANSAAPEEETAVYQLSVVDQNGDPVPGAVVKFCTDESCVPVTADEAGKLSYSAAPQVYHVEVLSVPEGYEAPEGELLTEAASQSLTLTVTKLG